MGKLGTKLHRLVGLSVALAAVSACTGQPPGVVRLKQITETFSSQLQINTKIDMLWVVDNSSSMDVSQQKLRNGFAAFASKYMQPTWDIRVAVITTDTYLANPAFSSYLTAQVAGSAPPFTISTTNYPYLNSRINAGTWSNPSYNTSLINLNAASPSYKQFPSGFTIHDLVPVWGANYAKLLSGNHDGPITAMCFDGFPYFRLGATNCALRDDPTNNLSGPSRCTNPQVGDDTRSQCVNTVENDTVRSGKAIISTMPPSGTPADAAWTTQLNKDFMVNVSTGSAGHGSERGLGSILQLITDNEGAGSSSKFFRPGSLRAIVIVSDEDDQTMTIPSGASLSPWAHYACDPTSLHNSDPGNATAIDATYCCAAGQAKSWNGSAWVGNGGNCQYGAEGLSCSAKTVDTHTYTRGVCPLSANLVPVTTVKSQLDGFFLSLDGTGATSPNYVVSVITPLTGTSISNLQTARDADDTAAGAFHVTATDRGDRYIALANAVGNGSNSMDIAANDYSSILDAIGQTIISQKGTFILSRAPTTSEEMIVKVLHQDGSSTVIPASVYSIVDKSLVITDLPTVLAFTSTDQILINYQPKTLF